MFITAFPTLPVKYLLSRKIDDLFKKLYGSNNIFYYYRGSNAIWNLINALKLKPDDNILVPSFNCGIEISAILEAKVKVKYYGLKESLLIDIEDIKRKIDINTRAVFIIHYFGFPQLVSDIKKICRERDLFLIEDCAHALLSRSNGEYLGKFGDFSIFSFKKSLPVPDGGAVVINRNNVFLKAAKDAPGNISVMRGVVLLLIDSWKLFCGSFYKLIELLFMKPVRFLFKVIKKPAFLNLKVTTSNSLDFDLDNRQLGISAVSLKILSNIDFDKVIDKRRSNFLFLLKELKGVEKIKYIFSGLPEGVCPLFFPIAVESRDHLQEILLKQGIETFIFGKFLNDALPRDQFPVAEYYSGHNLCLPIHQDLNERHLKYISEIIKKELTNSRLC